MAKTTNTIAVRALAPALCLLALLLFSACASTTRPDREVPFTGDHLAYHEANIKAASPRNKTLWQYRAAATAIRRDKSDLAKTYLDAALASASAAYGQPNKDAAKSRGLFKSEAAKPFVGEPYERVMANFYRALLYWADGEPDNARALLRTAALLDSDTVDKTYAADYILLDYLDGLITAKLAANNPAAGTAALARARASAAAQHAPAPPDYDLAANVHLFVEYGRAPQKYATGEAGERLQFEILGTPVKHVRLRVDSRTFTVPAYDDLGYQAVTRGAREMDYILGNKVVFKKTADNVAHAAIAIPALLAKVGQLIELDNSPSHSSSPPPPTFYPPGGMPSNSNGSSHSKSNHSNHDNDSNNHALAAVLIPVAIAVAALMTIYAGAKTISHATKTQADTRAWDNLPRYLCYLPFKLPPGAHTAALDFLDEDMKPIYLQKQTFTITVPPPSTTFAPAPKDIIIFRSQLHD